MSDPNLYLGIDPGRGGGIAVIHADGSISDLVAMPDVPEVLFNWLNGFHVDFSHAAIEKVGGYVKGTGVQPGAHMFNFGLFAGWAQMALVAAGIETVSVSPVRWQRDLGVSPRDKHETKPNFKRRLRQIAEGMYPDAEVTLHTADALLLAEWCRRRFSSQFQKGLLS